jgi:D-alanine-D-alanine ligase
VLRGGPSSEFEISLQSGSNVLSNLPDNYQGIDIFIDKERVWHKNGVPTSQYDALKNLDVVFNALHGEYGEDGKLQQELEALWVPYTGSRTLGAALSMNKSASKEHYKKIGLHVPQAILLEVGYDFDEQLFKVFKETALPVVIKPISSGSSLGVTIARSLDDIEKGVRKAFAYSPKVLVEEYIPGKEATVGVIENFRGEDIYALAPIEIRPTNNTFFDYDAKYKDRAVFICPGDFYESDKRALREFAKAAHEILGLRHYSRSDFIVSPERGIYILETNALPGLTPHSLIPKALETANISMGDFLDHALSLALEKN